jgi:hypothetical protein
MLVREAGLETPLRNLRVAIAHGVMIRTSEAQQKYTYTVRNEDASQRTLIIEHPVRPGWSLSKDTLRPEETTVSTYRFRVIIAPKQAATLEIKESHPIETRVELTNLTEDQLVLMVKDGAVTAEVEQALRKILSQKDTVAALDSEREKRGQEIVGIYNDQQRLRENLKALKGSAEDKALTQRYTQQLSDQETRLDKLNAEKADFEKKNADAQEQLDKMIGDLTIEATL